MTIASRVMDLSLLPRGQGFIIRGDSANVGIGESVSPAGDVNGDGIDDLITRVPNRPPKKTRLRNCFLSSRFTTSWLGRSGHRDCSLEHLLLVTQSKHSAVGRVCWRPW